MKRSRAADGGHAADDAPSSLGTRPVSAFGKFLRILTINDVYTLDNYPRVATAVRAARAEADQLGCVVSAHLNGDFLSPCNLSAIDGGRGMTLGLNHAQLDYVCLGNHEFDLGFDACAACMEQFHGKCLNSNVSDAPLAGLPEYDTLAVGERTVLVGGFLTPDTSIYPPCMRPSVTDPAKAAVALWQKATAELGRTPDLLLPMTHQLVREDRAFCGELAKHAEIGARMPLVLGGHEHEVYVLEAAKSMIVKVGYNAARIGVCDVWWDAMGTLHWRAALRPSSEFTPEPRALRFIEQQRVFLTQFMAAPLARVPESMSSKRVRFEPSGVASFLLTFVQRALQAEGAELAMVQGGFVRAQQDYAAGSAFTLGDLFSEFAFEGPFTVVPLRGDIIQASVQATRSAPKPAPNFLHFDAGVVVRRGETHAIVSVGGVPFDPDRTYMVATYQFLLTGLNVIEPLYSHVCDHVQVPDLEACRPIKEIVIKQCMKNEWRRLIRYDSFDLDGNGVSLPELRAGLRCVVASMDQDGDGLVSPDELCSYVRKVGESMPLALVEQMIKTLDADGNGKLSVQELEVLMQ